MDRKVTDPRMADYLTERAGSFGQSCEEGDVPSDMEIALNTTEESPGALDAGGLAPNDLRLISPVDLERSPVLTDYLSGKLGRDVTPENATCAFTTTRFFAAATSRADPLHHPVIGITDSVYATVQQDTGQDNEAITDVLVVDCAGVNDRMRGTFNTSSPPPGQKIDQNQSIPGRTSLINAYFDYLVGYTQGQKVYVPFDPSKSAKFNPSQGSIEYGGVRVVEYQKIFAEALEATPTPPTDANVQDPPNDANYPADIAEFQGQLSDAWPVLPDMDSSGVFLAGGEMSAVDLPFYTIYYTGSGSVEYSFALPQGAEKRYGDPVSWTYAGAWPCEGQGFDGCGECCDGRLSDAVGGIALLGTSLATGCFFTGPFAIGCWITSGILLAGMYAASRLSHSGCRGTGCNRTFYRVPGSPPD